MTDAAGAATASAAAGLQPGRAFLLLAGLFGVTFLLLTPPLQVPDEIRHLSRAYMISEGKLLAVPLYGMIGHAVPRSVALMDRRVGAGLAFHPEHKLDRDEIRRELKRELAPERRAVVPLPAPYSPLAYGGPALTIVVARWLDLAPILYVYLGRLANLALWMALVYAALRLAPAHRFTLLLLALMPMSLFEAASLAADCPTNGFAFLLLAVALRLAAAPEGAPTVGLKEGLWLCLPAMLLGLTKPSYWALAGLALLVPARRFRSTGQRLLWVGAIILLSLLPLLLWTRAVSGLDLPPFSPGADPGAQARFILGHPLAYGMVLLRTMGHELLGYGVTFIGVLGHLDTPLPRFVYVLYPLLVLAVAVFDGGPASPVGRWARLILLLTAAAAWVLTLTSAYVGWNTVGSSWVEGVQGRYLIPIMPLVLVALHRSRGPSLAPPARLAAVTTCAGVLMVSAVALYVRYHVG